MKTYCLHELGKGAWKYKGITPAEAKEAMSLVLKQAAAEQKRRAGLLKPGASNGV